MAREKTIMELQDILKRLKAGHTIKQINRETGTHRGVIRKLKNIALQNDWFKKDKRKRQIRPIFTGGSNCAMLSLKRRLAWNRTRKSTTQNSGLSISGNGKRAAYPGGDTAPERIYPIGPFCIG